MPAERAESRHNRIDLLTSEINYRSFWRPIFSIPIRNQIVAGRENLADAAKFVKETGLGVAVEFVHFSQTDPLQVMLAMTSLPAFRHSRIVAPFARHHVPNRFPLLEITRSMGVELFPVVTENTIKWAQKRKDAQVFEVGQGVEECMERTAQVLSGGGISVSAPQGERRPYLNHWEVDEEDREGHPTMAGFDISIRRLGVDDYGIIFAGLEIPGYFDYSKLDRFNIEKRPYLVRWGQFFTREEAIRQAGGTARNLDEWGFGQAASVCPPSYSARDQSTVAL